MNGVDSVLAALADPMRRQILDALAARGGASASWMNRLADQWDARLAAIKRIAES